MNNEPAPRLSNAERRKLREASDRADREAMRAALMEVIRNPAARPGDVVRAAELLQKGLFYRDKYLTGGDR